MTMIPLKGVVNGFKFEFIEDTGMYIRYLLTTPDGSMFHIQCNSKEEALRFTADPQGYYNILAAKNMTQLSC